MGVNEHKLNNKETLVKVSNHNIRAYDTTNNSYDKNLVDVIYGDPNKTIYQQMEESYHRIFDQAVIEHNQLKKDKRAIILDYFDKVSNLQKLDIGIQFIIGIGKKINFPNQEFRQHREEFNQLFRDQIDRLVKLTTKENGKLEIVQATVHYDESTPHMHLIAIPVKYTPDKDLKVRVNKKIIVGDNMLTFLQDEMRKGVANRVAKILNDNTITEKPKSDGHDTYYNVSEYKYISNNKAKLEKYDKETDKKIDKINKSAIRKIKKIGNKIRKSRGKVRVLYEEQIELSKRIKSRKKKLKKLDKVTHKVQKIYNETYDRADQELQYLKLIKREIKKKEQEIEEKKKEIEEKQKEQQDIEQKIAKSYDELLIQNSAIQQAQERKKDICESIEVSKRDRDYHKQDLEKIKSEKEDIKEDIKKLKQDYEIIKKKMTKELEFTEYLDKTQNLNNTVNKNYRPKMR